MKVKAKSATSRARDTYVVQERMGKHWVTLAYIPCPLHAAAHVDELKTVAPEPPEGGRYRFFKSVDPR